MTSAATALPPPLSDAPSIETLERLLTGLHQPMQRGVPTPPAIDETLDLTVFEAAAAPTAPAPSPAPVVPAPPAAVPDVAPPAEPVSPPSMSWSAPRNRRGLTGPRATALGIAAASAAGVVAGLVAAGEMPLP